MGKPNEGEDIFTMLSAARKVQPSPPEAIEAEVVQERERYNPTVPGRQSADSFNLQKLAREKTEEAFNVVLQIMNHAEDDCTRLEAAKQILDRGWGKPSVKIQAETVTYSLRDVEAKLLEKREAVDLKVLEARKIERARLAEYLTSDAEVVGDTTSHSG